MKMEKKIGPCPHCQGDGRLSKTTGEITLRVECPECLGIGVFNPAEECVFENEDGTCERERLRAGKCACRANSRHNAIGHAPGAKGKANE
jgi:DnaJ-class molecular chaperone